MKKTIVFLSLSANTAILLSFVNQPQTTDEKWFPVFDFDAAAFKKAPREFGSYTRW